ncbi:MAG: Cyclohexa-1,5-dienecarbonyl-CoA hydratase [Ignavibacteria bacterium]|nr:Cyclohexa-1,5-dienecarbonyl-CoA hydratase [Ignavibacteria bacterium]
MNKIKINFSHNDSVARIILDDGKGNVIDKLMMAELKESLDSFKDKNNIKLLVFEGAGKHFSFGASIEEHKKENAEVMIKSFHKLFYALSELSIPTISLISGQCLGGGLELALMCNIIFADKSAKLGQPEIVLGVFPPPASLLLQEKIGLAKAEDLLITGKVISSDDARAIGLVNELFENKEQMESGLNNWIEANIVPKSSSSLRFAVKASRIKLNNIIRNFLPQLESMYINELMETHDACEGINSFLEKRKPVWKNN